MPKAPPASPDQAEFLSELIASGLSVEDFQKRITVQELTPAGLKALSGTACTLAALEGLDAHAAAVNIRLAALGSPAA